MNRNRPMLFIIVWTIMGLIYSPIFITAWVLHIVFRIGLCISYLGLLNGQRAKDVFKSLFRFNPTL